MYNCNTTQSFCVSEAPTQSDTNLVITEPVVDAANHTQYHTRPQPDNHHAGPKCSHHHHGTHGLHCG